MDAGTLVSRAKSDFGYFFALKTLTPFAVANADAVFNQSNSALYDQWAEDKGLGAEARAQGNAHFTDEYLTDRAAMLSWVVKRNRIDSTATILDAPNEQVFTDAASATIIRTGASPGGVFDSRKFYFGSAGADAYAGGSKGDRLYGGDGWIFNRNWMKNAERKSMIVPWISSQKNAQDKMASTVLNRSE